MGRGRAPCCDKTKVKKGPWSPAEDLRLTTFVQNQGHTNWRALPKQAGLLRCGKSCRLRWINYLRPDVKRGNFTSQEEEIIINLHNSIGNKWSSIASYLPGRTDNEIKNVWNTHLRKKIKNQSKESHCHNKTEVVVSKPNSSTSASESSTSSSIILFDDPKSKKPLINRNIEKSDSSKNPKDSISDHSPTSSYASISNSRETVSDFSKTEIINLGDDEKIEIPLETYIDFWELFYSLGENHITETPKVCEQDDDIENEWFRVLENELGLDCDTNTLPRDQYEAPKDFGNGFGAKN